MKTILWPILAVSYFATLGNGQDGAVPPPPPNGYGIQGNVQWNKALHDADLDRAVYAARQKKAMMEAMASYSQKPPVITSAEQFLAVHRPAAPISPEGAGPNEAARSNSYVPEFNNSSSRSGGINSNATSAPPRTSAASMPEKKSGLFGLFKSKEEEAEFSSEAAPSPDTAPELPPSAAYPEPSPDAVVASMPPAPPAESMSPVADESAAPAPTESAKPSILGRLFGKKATEPSSTPDPTLSAPTAPLPSAPLPAEGTMPTILAANDPTGIPEPPSFAAPTSAPPAVAPPASAPVASPPPAAPAASAGTEASIFIRRSNGGGDGTSATVLTTTQATVDGVLVKLYEGSSVTVLERSGSMARVRLPDQRVGSVAASALSR